MTTAAAPVALATPANLAAYMDVDEGDLDDQATFMLAGAAGAVRTYCRWPVAARTDDRFEVPTGDSGGSCLMLPTLHLTSVTSVTIRGREITDYEPWQAGYLERLRGWPARSRVVVVADHGLDPVPDEVTAVVCAAASRAMATAGLGPVSQYRVDGVSATYGRNTDLTDTIMLLPGEQLVLDAYRVPVVS